MRLVIDGRCIQDHFPGIGRYVYNLVDALAPLLEGELHLVVNPAQPNSRYDLGALARHPNLRLHAARIPTFHWREQTHLPRLLHSLQPDVVHLPYNVRPLRLHLPTLLTLYDAIPRRFPGDYALLNRLRIELIQRLAIRASRAFVAISQATADDFSALYGIAHHRITVTPLAADPAFRPQPPSAVADLRQRLGLPERYVLYVGANKPHKNLPRLIEAWSRVVHERRVSEPPASARGTEPTASARGAHAWVLVIAGAWDPRYPAARQRAEALGLTDSLRFLGAVPAADLPALYAGAGLFVFPSLYEGFGLPVLEAMACAAPVACSHASSLPEVAGDAAALFDPTSVTAISQTIQGLLADAALRAQMSEASLAQAARFSWQATAQRTLAAYRQLTGA